MRTDLSTYISKIQLAYNTGFISTYINQFSVKSVCLCFSYNTK